MIDGKKEAELTKELQTPLLNNGDVYQLGIEAGKVCDLKSNPQFSTRLERIAYRNGWMAGMKIRMSTNIQIEV